MIDEFRSRGLVAAAQSLGINPFELVRLSVALDSPTKDLRFTAETLDEIRNKADIRSLWKEYTLPQASSPVESAIRGAATLLLTLELVGSNTTRLDNLSRGLSAEQQEAIDEATALLAEDGSLLLLTSPAGLQVSIAPGHEGAIRSLADGSGAPDAVRALWME